MVVKPAANLSRGRKGLVQPGLKVRGAEYLRIIYGPDYTEPANLDRLRAAASATSARWPCGSTRSGWRRSTGSRAGSRCGGCTSACSRCWRWSPSRSTRAYDRAAGVLFPSSRALSVRAGNGLHRPPHAQLASLLAVSCR